MHIKFTYNYKSSVAAEDGCCMVLVKYKLNFSSRAIDKITYLFKIFDLPGMRGCIQSAFLKAEAGQLLKAGNRAVRGKAPLSNSALL